MSMYIYINERNESEKYKLELKPMYLESRGIKLQKR